MEEDRRAFGSLPDTANKDALNLGIEIFKHLRERYPNSADVDYDQIMNTLCVALICLIKSSCPKDNYNYILQVIHKILSNNLA